MGNATALAHDAILDALPPGFWQEEQTMQLMVLGVVGAWAWDVLVSLGDEYRMFRRCGIRLPDVVYVLARLTTGWFFGVTTAFVIAPIHNCHVVARVQSSAASIQIPFNALLFLFRIRAVFHEKRIVFFAFVVLWLGLFGTCMSALLSLDATPLPGTGRCLEITAQKTAAASLVYGAVYDTLVFAAISTQLVLFYQHAGRTWKVFLTGRGMGDMSRILLQTSQQYYIVTVGFTILCSALVLTPSVPPPYSNTSILLSAFFTNAMATRIYRNLKNRPPPGDTDMVITQLNFGRPGTDSSRIVSAALGDTRATRRTTVSEFDLARSLKARRDDDEGDPVVTTQPK
ncbi:hypothetical protein EIP91_005860 [Steccherinum ochraceum]|uniref:Transmembrane protein n=1 Tax=Steccherinum ochraceum TaxID=92696 RepID=A0A4R0R9E2_9APHY|nr:hypothetical protein EIP91_005860 [Steccherinum ochraceum]